MEGIKKQEIRIIAERRETRDGSRKFMTYKAVQKDGTLIDCRFTKTVRNVPDKSCKIIVNPNDANVDKSKLYPILWVKAIDEVIYQDGSKQSEANAKELEELFG